MNHEGEVLRFEAVMADCTEPTDVDRKFIISYYIRSGLKRSISEIYARPLAFALEKFCFLLDGKCWPVGFVSTFSAAQKTRLVCL